MTWFVVERTSNPQTFSIAEQIPRKVNIISTLYVAHVCDGRQEKTAKLLAAGPDLADILRRILSGLQSPDGFVYDQAMEDRVVEARNILDRLEENR